MNVVYKIMTLSEWKGTCTAGEFLGSTVDRNDGYIHFSAADQVEQTVVRHFAGSDVLMLVAVNVEKLGQSLRFERSRGGALFPHLYANLKVDDILWSKQFESSNLESLRNLIVD